MRNLHERERKQLILRLVREQALVAVSALVQTTGASSATVRRDLASLESAGLVRRVHGGVEVIDEPKSPILETRGFAASRTLNVEKKRAIARAAVDLCSDGQSIIINAGSTTYQMVDPLARRRLNILTNSFPIAEALVSRGQSRVSIPGGEIFREQAIVLSPFDDDAIQHTAAEIMFMSCYSIGPMGVIEGDPLIARAEVKLLKRAEKLVVLIDSSKFVTRGAIVVCPLSRVSTVITDDAAPPRSIAMLRAAGVEVVVVSVDARQKAQPAFA